MFLPRGSQIGGYGSDTLFQIGLFLLRLFLVLRQFLLTFGHGDKPFVISFHQFELGIFQRGNLFFRMLDLMIQRGEFLILARLLLLRPVTRDGGLLGLNFKVEFFPVGFDLPGVVF